MVKPATNGPSPDVVAIFNRIESLSPPDKLRLAAGLMEGGRGDIAHKILDRVTTELGAALALARTERPSRE